MKKNLPEMLLMYLPTVILMVAAFWVGTLYARVTYLEKNGTPTAAVGTQTQPAAAAPVTQLSDDQWNEVLKAAVNKEGKSDAKVTIVEFTDFQCPFCEQYFTQTYGQIKKDYIDSGKVQYIVENLPLPFHPNAHIGAEAAACAGDQKKFWEMHDKLFANQSAWVNDADPKPKYGGYAQELGLNVTQFNKCLTDGKFKQKVDDDAALAAKVGANGTPSFFINGKLLVGAQPYSEFQREIDDALSK